MVRAIHLLRRWEEVTNDADKVLNTKKKCRAVARQRNDCRKKQGRQWAGNGPKSHTQGEEATRHSVDAYTVEVHWFGRWLSLSPIIGIGLALRGNLSRILKN